MDSYTYGSPEGVAALKEALLNNPGEGHLFQLSRTDQLDMAMALETASFAGKPWADAYTGVPVEQAEAWPPRLAEMDLNDEQMLGLVDALALAFELGHDFAGEWLSGLGECVDIEWI